MEFSINKDNFLNALRLAEHVCLTKGIQVVLSNIYIEAKDDNEIIIKGSDMDLGMILRIKADVKEAGSLTLPSKKLCEIVSKLPDDEVKIEVPNDSTKAKIISGRAKFELMGVVSTEYPAIISDEDLAALKKSISLDIEIFSNAIKQTSFAASIVENCSIYNGVNININGKNLEMVATDGARLSLIKETVENDEENTFECIIPAKTLVEFLKFSAFCEGKKVELLRRENKIIFKIDNNVLLSRIIEGQYPKYKQIIPVDNTKIVVLPREEFLNSVDRTSAMVEEKKSYIKVTIEKNRVVLDADNPELGECTDVVDATYSEDEEMVIAFNFKYLLDVLRMMSSEKIRMELKTPLSPVLIKTDDSPNYLALVMPIQMK